MKKKYQGIIYVGIFIISLLLGFALQNQTKGYHVLFFTICGIVAVKGGLLLWSNSTPEKSYKTLVNGLLSTYDSILVKLNTVPKIGDRSIVKVASIDDMIDAQFEIKKPICYIKQSESCTFLLLDKNVAYIYSVKLNDKVKTPVDIELQELKLQRKNRQSMDLDLFNDIDKTSVVKLSNLKSYKVSSMLEKTTKIEALEIV